VDLNHLTPPQLSLERGGEDGRIEGGAGEERNENKPELRR